MEVAIALVRCVSLDIARAFIGGPQWPSKGGRGLLGLAPGNVGRAFHSSELLDKTTTQQKSALA